jgi:DNA-directed RNA polymerase subunit K/omega
MNAAKTTVTRNVDELDKETGNIYEAVAILGKRANQIAQGIKEELGAKLEEFAVVGENLEEVYENREQIEISKHYERLPKPRPSPSRNWRKARSSSVARTTSSP